MKPYYVGHIFYLPLCHAVSLINKGYSKDEAYQITVDKFAYFGRRNSKRNKDFDRNQFKKHLDRFVSIPGAYLVRKSKSKKSVFSEIGKWELASPNFCCDSMHRTV